MTMQGSGPSPVAKDGVSGLIPEVYYDLIARISPGVLFVLVVAAPYYGAIKASGHFNLTDFTSLVVLIGFGYLAGHMLTTVSVVWNGILWNRLSLKIAKRRIPLTYEYEGDSASDVFDELYRRIDWVAGADQAAGVILKKMEAASALTDNVLSGFIVVLVCSLMVDRIGAALPISSSNCLWAIAVFFFLLVSSVMRRAILVRRLDGLLKLHGYGDSEASRATNREKK